MYNKKQLKVENASGHKKKNPNMKKGTHQNIQSSVNDMFMRNQTMFGPSGKRRYLPMEQGGDPDELYNMKRAIELGYQADENGHWPSVDSENGMWLKSKAHPTAWKEYMYGQLNADLAKNYDVRANPEGPFGEDQLQYVPKKQNGGWLDEYDKGGPIKKENAGKKPPAEDNFYKPKTKQEYLFRSKMYADSAALADQGRKAEWIWKNNPNISKEEYDKLVEQENDYPQYSFVQEQYDIDKKKKAVGDFKDYIHQGAWRDHKNSNKKSITGKDLSEGIDLRDKRIDKEHTLYSKTWVDKQGRTHTFDAHPYGNGRNGFESIYDPQSGTTIEKNIDYDYPEFNRVFNVRNSYMKPEKVLYKGNKEKQENGKISSSTSSTGWYDPKLGKPKFKNNSKEEYISYHHETERHNQFAYPKQKILKPDPDAPEGEPMTMRDYVKANSPVKSKQAEPIEKVIQKDTTSQAPALPILPTPTPVVPKEKVRYRTYQEGLDALKNKAKGVYPAVQDFDYTSKPKKKQQGGWLDQYDDGGSIVNYLASKGQDYSKKGRETLAKKMGVKDYDFSAEKNLELLDKLKSVGRVKPMKEQQLPEVTITPWTKDINAYEKGNPKQAFIDSKKREYLNASGIRGLNKLAGLSSDNFPANKELEYIKEYEYKKNNKLAPKIIASYGNPKDRSTWVEKLTPQEYEIVKNSDYRFDLEPNAFETTYAALNKMVSPMPNRYVQPTKGLTQNEMQNIGALNSFDFLNVPGQALGSVMRSPNLPGNPNNAYANNSMMKGLQGYHDPHRLEGEEILANPLNWTMGYDAALMLGQAPKVAAAVSNTVKNMPKTSKDIIYKVADLALDNPLGEKLVNKMADKRLPQYVPDTPTPQTLLPGDAEKIKELSTFVNKHEEIIKDARLNQLRAQGYSLKDARAIRDYETAKFLGEYDFGNIPQKTVEKITKKTSKEMAKEYANTANFKQPTPKEGTNFTIKPDPSLHGKIYKTVDELKKARVLRKEVEAALNPIPNPTPFQKFYIEKIIKKAFKNKYKMDIPTVDDFILAEQNQLIPTIESIDRANPRQDLFNASKRGKEMPKGVPFMGGASLSDNSFPIALKLTEKAIKEGKATPFFMAHGPMNNWGHLAQYANDPELMLRNANEAIKDFNTNQTKVKLPYAYLKNDVVHYPRLGLKNHKKGGSVDWLSQFEKGGSTNWLDNY